MITAAYLIYRLYERQAKHSRWVKPIGILAAGIAFISALRAIICLAIGWLMIYVSGSTEMTVHLLKTDTLLAIAYANFLVTMDIALFASLIIIQAIIEHTKKVR